MKSLSTHAVTTAFMLLAAVASTSLASGIYDNANLFSDSLQQAVLDQLNRVEKESGHETIVETIAQAARSEFSTSP